MIRSAAVIFALASSALAQTFDVASVKPSAGTVGKDYNNQITARGGTFEGKNVTLKRLIVEAYGLVPAQVAGGPKWLDETEFDVAAKSAVAATTDQFRAMLQALLTERFHLAAHREKKEMRVWEMVPDKGGPTIKPVAEGQGTAAPLGSRHFHGELRQLANLISVQLTILMVEDPTRPGVASGPPSPVLDKTGLSGVFDFDLDMRPEADPLAMWQAFLQQKLGLKLEGKKSQLDVLVVDRADPPSAN